MGYRVRVNLNKGYVSPSFITIFGQSKNRIKKLFENYNKECESQNFYGCFGQYLTSKNVAWDALDFDIDLMP